MNDLIKLHNRAASVRLSLCIVVTTCVALVCSLPALAHGPGLNKIDIITTQLVENGEQAELYAKRAHVFQNNHMWQEAMADFDRAVELDSQNVKYDLDRAGLSLEAGAYLRALDFINLYLLRHANNTEAALIKARSFRALGQYKQSIDSYQVALADLSNFDGRPLPEWYVEFADTFLLAGKKSDALRILQLGIDELGAPGVFQVKAAELEVDLGLYDSALGRIDLLLHQSQRKDLWLARRAEILSRAGRANEARQTYEQAYSALRLLPQRLQNLPVSIELAHSLQQHIGQH